MHIILKNMEEQLKFALIATNQNLLNKKVGKVIRMSFHTYCIANGLI